MLPICLKGLNYFCYRYSLSTIITRIIAMVSCAWPQVYLKMNASSHLSRLRATLLRNPHLSAKEKAHLICSLILPKFLHGASLWFLHRNQEKQAFHALVMGFYRRSIRPVLGASTSMATDLEVCTARQVLTPQETLVRLHIMQWAFLAAHATNGSLTPYWERPPG